MKRINLHTFTIILLLLALSAATRGECLGETATPSQAEACADDSVEISLLTCSPHDEVYSLYGHTAIRYQDKSRGADLVVNYGMFSFRKPHFVLRFVFGKTDYEMGITTFDDFCREYSYYGSSVTQQTLNLTPQEKQSIIEALQRNYLPENRTYRYNFLTNNCTTKARDIILQAITAHGNYVDTNRGQFDEGATFRSVTHLCNSSSPWARLGNDLLLGVKADRKLTREEQEFLPAYLQRDFDKAVIRQLSDGKERPLVSETTVVVEGDAQNIAPSRNPSPTLCAIVLAAMITAASIAEAMTRRRFILADALWLTLVGLPGLILTAMIFSEHPTTSLNLQILVLNPLALYGAFYVVRNRHRQRRLQLFWLTASAILSLAVLSSAIQTFAEGILILALSLLLRSAWSIYHPISTRQQDKNIR